MPGRRTLTATSRPSVVTAQWTCAIEAAPTGTSSNLEYRLSSGALNDVSIVRLILANGAGGRSSWSSDRFAAALAPTRSGRVDSAWPSLIAAGPIATSALAYSGVGGTRAPKRAILASRRTGLGV